MLAIRRDRPGVRAWGAAALTAAVIGVALAIPFAPYLAARANVSGSVATEARSIDERLALAGLAVEVFTDRPLLGTGLGTVPEAMRATDPAFEFAYQPAHVVLIDAAAETGIVGGACYLALVVAPWLALAAARRRWTRQLAGASAAVAAVTVVGLFDFYTWTASAGRTWAWILLGVWVVAYRAATEDQVREVPEPDPRPDG
jgi:O-antigen ligase